MSVLMIFNDITVGLTEKLSSIAEFEGHYDDVFFFNMVFFPFFFSYK